MPAKLVRRDANILWLKNINVWKINLKKKPQGSVGLCVQGSCASPDPCGSLEASSNELSCRLGKIGGLGVGTRLHPRLMIIVTKLEK